MVLSIVIPVFNEEPSIRPLYEGVVRAVEPLRVPFEVILVDDGSTDASIEVAEQIAATDSRLRVLMLRTNFGQTAALHAGIEASSGSIVVTMDGDLQNDPDDIPMLIRQLDDGYDMVAGWRAIRYDKLWSRRIPSKVANWLISRTLGTSVRDNGCALRAYRSEVIRNIPLYSEMHRLLPFILSLTGARISDVAVRHHPRRYGKSKYGLSRVYKVILDLIALKWVLTRHRTSLFGFGMSALLLILLNIPIFSGVLVSLFLDPTTPIVVFSGAFLLIGSLGVFLLLMGILAEIIYRTGYVRVETLFAGKTIRHN